ncbi:MAG TPA: hypothetical protein VKR83_06640, partial [Ktedonobacteraceae bacterium]|nr:hypothetical protein [Ktedonobacteraceae bacterium]
MSIKEQRQIALKPVINYPREAQAGQSYLMTIDLRVTTNPDAWPYDDEEFPVYFSIDTMPLFSYEPVGQPLVVVHRFGGTYGPAAFLLTAAQGQMAGEIHITMINRGGVPITEVTIECEIKSTEIPKREIGSRDANKDQIKSADTPKPRNEMPYSIPTWRISEEVFDADKLRSQETVCTIGNGYFGTRGSFEEGYPYTTPATLLYGVFDSIAVVKEELANVPDWLQIELFVNGERFRLDQGKLIRYRRVLDMQRGVLHREVHWESPRGVRLYIASERFASLADEHVGAMRYSVTVDPEQQIAGEKFDIAIRAALNMA